MNYTDKNGMLCDMSTAVDEVYEDLSRFNRFKKRFCTNNIFFINNKRSLTELVYKPYKFARKFNVDSNDSFELNCKIVDECRIDGFANWQYMGEGRRVGVDRCRLSAFMWVYHQGNWAMYRTPNNTGRMEDVPAIIIQKFVRGYIVRNSNGCVYILK
jgi:hypothetical protein